MLRFRNMLAEDREKVLSMARDFYQGEAVLHPADPAVIARTFADAIDPAQRLLRGTLLLQDGNTAGYLYVTECYSAEVGGTCVFLEQLYLLPQYRGLGLGREAMKWLEGQYAQALRLRLEVNQSNCRAIRLYQSMGYQKLEYGQLVLDRK